MAIHCVFIALYQTSSRYVAYFYVLSWLFLGAYIFQNLATGVMVSSYQTIREKMDELEAGARDAALQQANVNQLLDKVGLSYSTTH